MVDPAFRPAAVAGIVALIAAAALTASNINDFSSRLREAAFDRMSVLMPPDRAAESVVVIDIDRQSLAAKGSWPWRRGMVADLVQKTQIGRPNAIGIDILLSGEDRRSPRSLLHVLATETGRQDLASLAASLPDDDEKLSAVIAQSDVVLGLIMDDQGQDVPPPSPLIFMAGRPKPLRLSDSAGVAAPLPRLSKKAVAVGAMSFSAGPGGVVRDVPLFIGGAGRIYAGFAAEVLRASENAASFVIEEGSPAVSIGSYKLAAGPGGTARVRFSLVETWQKRTVSAATVLDGAFDPARFEGKIVLIGSSAPEAGALIATPMDSLTPTVQLQAEAVETFKSGIPERASSAALIEFLAGIGLALAALAAALLLTPAASAFTLFGIIASWVVMCVLEFSQFNRLIDPVGPLLPALASWNIAGIVLFSRMRKLRNAIERKFGRYLAPQVVSRLIRSPSELKIEGELREVTALFSDIEGFSTMSETAEPRMLVSVLDAYFEGACAIVIRHGGMVDKIVGDAVHALFNAPLDLKDHARAAFDCALEIDRFTTAFRMREDARTLGFGRTRIGLETGPAIVGDVGGLGHLDYTAHGDAVNSAARLEALNKEFGTTICVGERAADAIAMPQRLRPLKPVILRGRASPILVHSPWSENADEELKAAYLAAYGLIKMKPKEAAKLFETLSRHWPEDPVSAYWAKRLEESQEIEPLKSSSRDSAPGTTPGTSEPLRS